MTRIVASAVGDTPDALYDAARKAAQSADLVEVRLDTPSGMPWDLRPWFLLDVPAIATVRHELDGGRSSAEDRDRADILRRALRGGAKGIDVEAWSDEAPALVKEAKQGGALAIVSRHLLDSTPTEDEILEMLRQMRALGADVAKLATRTTSPADAVALVRAAERARREGIPCALMAVNDPFLRLLAPALGMALVYASVPGAPAAAPGQVPAPDVRLVHAALSDIRATTRAVYLLGQPVAHSKSPAFQNAAFRAADIDARFLALDISSERLAATIEGLKAMGALGCNVTMPHKEAALALVDEADDVARAARAVNTIAFRGGRAFGHNTDGAGAVDALAESGVRLEGVRVLLLGAGGAARAVAHALTAAGANVTVANRTQARAADLGLPSVAWEGLAGAARDADVLVNATSVGMRGETLPLPLESLRAGATVFDCVYGATPLVREAQQRGLRVVRGEAMLLHQGARAFTLWTGKPAPLAAMRAALEASG